MPRIIPKVGKLFSKYPSEYEKDSAMLNAVADFTVLKNCAELIRDFDPGMYSVESELQPRIIKIVIVAM